MNIKTIPTFAAAAVIMTLGHPSPARASATYYCNNGQNCSGDGGNGDNGTNNGNNSSDNTVNVNLSPFGLGFSGGSTATNQSSTRGAYTYPVQLPVFPSATCGSRPTVYGGLSGTPQLFGANSNVGFGVGFTSAVGREPDICRPYPASYAPAPTSDGRTASSRTNGLQSVASDRLTDPVSGGAVVEKVFDARESSASPLTVARQEVATAPEPAAVPPQRENALVAAVVSTRSVSPAHESASTESSASACVRLDDDLAAFYSHDLRLAKHTRNTVRIARDLGALENGCFHKLAMEAIAE